MSRGRRMQEARRSYDEMMKRIGWDLETTCSPTTSGNGVHIDTTQAQNVEVRLRQPSSVARKR